MTRHLYPQFYAKLLGSFSLNFNGREIPVDVKLQNQYMQIFLMMIKAGSKGIRREKMIEIFPCDHGSRKRQLSNFRQQIYLLRKVIRQMDLPEGEYIVCKDEKFYFTCDYKIETDTGQLDRLIRQIQAWSYGKEEKYWELIGKFCSSYTGEFLPMLSGEEWVAAEGAYYQKWYFEYLKQLCDRLKQQGDYEKRLELCTEASQIHPYDEWQAVQIDCLMAMNRYKEAMKVYENAAHIFYEDLGLNALDQIMGKYRDVNGRFCYEAGALAAMQDALREPENAKGAYFCGYPSFLDIYHVVSRIGERTELESLLMVCTMSMPEAAFESEASQESWHRLSLEMERLGQVIQNSIRKEDVYTRYSANQFLILLIGAGEQDGDRIAARLEYNWTKINQNEEIKIHCSAEAVERLPL
ncbi:MAG: BTAD domain-containing putative transcriptional regulator [Lachnospiraceae bacterium]|nr:BTAD domain-containing putative transcriptional regulator [Lachnospiraceae bacterium]